jgi:hypothetical protein
MSARLSLVVGAVIGLTIPASALAENLDSSFHGHAKSSVSDPPGTYTVGETYEAYLVLDGTPSSQDPWYDWDQANYQYTLVITSTVDSYFFQAQSSTWIVAFAPTSVAIYEDDSTPADAANTSTYTDGSLLLAGTSSNFGGFSADGLLWAFTGNVDLLSGAGIDGLACHPSVDIIPNDYSHTFFPPPPGFDEHYAALWNCEGGISVTGVESSSWGRVKATYR